MRTTVAIDDEVLEAARRLARRSGTTLGALIEQALRYELGRTTKSAGPPIPVFRDGTGVQAGVDLTSNRALAELLDEGRDLDQLR